MYKLSWQDIEACVYTGFIAICTVCLAVIYVFVIRRCDAIIMAGDYCGVGIGLFGLAAGFFMIGAFSAWKVYRLAGSGSRPE